MRHRVMGRKFGRSTKHRKSMLNNLATELIRHNRIKTTESKAKSVQPIAEKLITLAIRGDLHSRRMAARSIHDPKVLQKLFDDVAKRDGLKHSGHTRIYKLGPRRGDAAEYAILELIASE